MAINKQVKKTAQRAPMIVRPALVLVAGQIVRVVGGSYAGMAGQVRGMPNKRGAVPLMIGGAVRYVQPENIAGE